MTDSTTGSQADGPAPPHNLKAERTVLRAMMRTADAVAEIVEILDGTEFYRPAHELIYNAVLEAYSRGETLDPVRAGFRRSSLPKTWLGSVRNRRWRSSVARSEVRPLFQRA